MKWRDGCCLGLSECNCAWHIIKGNDTQKEDQLADETAFLWPLHHIREKKEAWPVLGRSLLGRLSEWECVFTGRKHIQQLRHPLQLCSQSLLKIASGPPVSMSAWLWARGWFPVSICEIVMSVYSHPASAEGESCLQRASSRLANANYCDWTLKLNGISRCKGKAPCWRLQIASKYIFLFGFSRSIYCFKVPCTGVRNSDQILCYSC